MDRIDRHILRELQAHGRLTNNELAERVNLSPSPCLRRMRNLEKKGVIKGYTAQIDQKAYGLPITVFVHIRLDEHSTASSKKFEEAIKRVDEVLDCYLMTGNCDYLLRVLVKDLEAYEDFVRNRLHPIPGIASIDTSFAFGVIKHSKIYPEI
ncbi:MAG: Lrp/AsnC family transcriptional regulator [Cohaesibacter sp.]|jgi:DNA-binding Lrp family transcriptional regulator|nr:Lrp/AsnC family transcriptional regulator [Cohaesibacter sp.]